MINLSDEKNNGKVFFHVKSHKAYKNYVTHNGPRQFSQKNGMDFGPIRFINPSMLYEIPETIVEEA